MKLMRTNPFQKFYDKVNANEGIPDFPYLVDVELTNKCNFSCTFCRNSQITRDLGVMTDTTFEKIVDECAGKDCGIRLIRWGEPTLHPKLREYVMYAELKKVPVHLTTNGSASIETYKGVIDAGLDSIAFSLQGSTPSESENQRVGLDYKEFCETVDALEAYRADLEYPFMQLSCTMSDNDKQEDIDVFRQAWSDIFDKVVIGRTIDYVPVNDGEPCYDMRYKLAVDWNGMVVACCADYNQELDLNLVSEGGIEAAWKDDYLERWREVLANGERSLLVPCKTCTKGYKGV